MSRTRESEYNLLIKAKARPEGYSTVVPRGEMGLKLLEFGLIRLSGSEWSGETDDCEQAMDILSGAVSLEVFAPSRRSYERLGGRRDPFDGRPTVIYLPPNAEYRMESVEGTAEIAVFSALAPGFRGEPDVIGPEHVRTQSSGRDCWRWDTHTAIDDRFPAAKLLVGESVNPPGHWSNTPPHKHDAFIPPKEFPLEQISYFHLTPERGYGMARIYTSPNDPSPMNEVYVVENGDAVVIPRGYHPMVAAPGCSLHSTWALAGDIRRYGAWTLDPRHSWLLDAGASP